MKTACVSEVNKAARMMFLSHPPPPPPPPTVPPSPLGIKIYFGSNE